MNFFKKYFEPIIVGLCAIFLLGATYISMAQNARIAPPDRVYLGFEEYPIDYTWALDIMRQGYNGHANMFLQFSTTLPENRGYIKLEYLFIGRIAGIFGLDLIDAFHFSRFLISITYIFFLYGIIRSLFSDSSTRITAFLLVLFGTGISLVPKAMEMLGNAHDAQVFQRMTDASLHHILGALLSFVSLFFLAQSIQKSKNQYFFLVSIVCGMAAAIVFPPAMVMVLLSLPVSWILSVLIRIRKKNNLSIGYWHIGKLITYMGLVSIPMLYVRYVTSVLWAPHNFTHNEELNPFSVPLQYYPFIMGTTYLLSIISVPFVLKKPNTFLLLLLPWVVLHPLAEYILAPILSINKIRFFLVPYYVSFGILSSVTIRDVSRWLSSAIPRIPKYFWTILFIIITFGVSWQSYIVSYNTSRVVFWLSDNFSFGYPKKDLVFAMEWLQKNTQETDVVLTHLYSGNLVPGFSGNRVVTSWWHRLADSPGFYPLFWEVEMFYRGAMTENQARTFIKDHDIAYVLYSDSEKLAGTATLPYSFLAPVFTSGGTLVYRAVH